jgi:hypothetical protein
LLVTLSSNRASMMLLAAGYSQLAIQLLRKFNLICKGLAYSGV